jgi:hypothetical protein
MPRKVMPLRVTSIASFVNSEWKSFWYRSIEKGTKENPVGLIEVVANECVEFSKNPHTAAEWKAFLDKRTAMKEADRIGKESTDFGKAVHSIAEAFLLGQPEPTTITLQDEFDKDYTRPLTDREKFCGGLLVKWCKEAKVKPILLDGKPAIETPLEDEELGLTGHPDLVCTFGDDSTVWIVDWKTSKEFRLEYKLQLAAYVAMIKKKYGIEIDNGVIVRVPSDPNVMPQFETHIVRNLLTKFFQAFLHCLEAVKFFKNRGIWKELKEAA